jgi:hypothetical protein
LAYALTGSACRDLAADQLRRHHWHYQHQSPLRFGLCRYKPKLQHCHCSMQSTRLVRALRPALVMVLWHAGLQATSNVDLAQAQPPAPLAMLQWRVAL